MINNQKRFRNIFSIIVICLLLMTPFFISCGSSGGGGDNGGNNNGNGPGNEPPESVKLINSYSDATTESEKVDALQRIATSCPSIGVLDKDGKQLNPNVTNTDINFTQTDMDIFSTFIDEGHYRTIGEVIDFLNDAGVVLQSTGEAITFADVQQDIQSYVNWSFANADDPASILGLLLGSGPGMTVPGLAPVIESTTQISAMAATLLLSDFLIGVNDASSQSLSGNSSAINNAVGDDIKAKLFVTGLLGIINTFNDSIIGLINDGKLPIDVQRYEVAKSLLGSFAMGHHLRIGFCVSIDGAANSCNMVNPLEIGSDPKNLTIGIILPSDDNRFLDVSSIKADYELKLSKPLTGGDEQISESDKYDVVFGDGTKNMSFQASVKPEKIIQVKTSIPPTYNSSVFLDGKAKIILPEINIEQELKKLEAKVEEMKKNKGNSMMNYLAETVVSFLNRGQPQLATLVANQSLRSSSGSMKINVKVQSQELDVTISADPQSTFVNEWVFFDSTVNGGKTPYLYKWEFGDNESSTLHDDTHRYSRSGTFNVKLTVTDASDNETIATLQITVGDYSSEYVVYYTDNVRCWDAPWLYLGSREKFNSTEYRCNQSGGGIDCTQELIKTEIQGGFLTTEAAQDWICPKISAWHFHYWCSKHWVVDGQSLHFRLGNLGCDTSNVDEIPFPEGG